MPRTVAERLAAASRQIAAALGLDTREARLDARVLAAFAWDVAPAWLIAHDTDAPTAVQAATFDALLARRLAGEPVAYLTGVREFFGRPFRVTPDVLIPRPDTELLVERALACLPPDQPADVLDLGTGSGCVAIILALERPLARVVAVDQSAAALAVARQNAQTLGARVEFVHSHWFDALGGRRFNIIVSNPPYIPAHDPHLHNGDVRFEPRQALAAGPAGLDDLATLVQQAAAHLLPAGTLLLEHGYDQGPAVQDLFRRAGYPAPQTCHDLAGHPRVTCARLSD